MLFDEQQKSYLSSVSLSFLFGFCRREVFVVLHHTSEEQLGRVNVGVWAVSRGGKLSVEKSVEVNFLREHLNKSRSILHLLVPTWRRLNPKENIFLYPQRLFYLPF